VQGLPSGAAWRGAFKAEEDTVSLVESVGGDENREVFDVQVEGAPWFFADGILVHNCTIIDDPQTRRGADSEVERAASLQGMSDLSTRVTDPRIAAQVLIQQRLHVNDATDWALKNWRADRVHLMYPARFDPDRESSGDPRTYRGELLWPEVWSDAELRNIEAGLKALDGDRLSDYAVAGQLQQNPIPKGGGIIKREWIEAWPPTMPDGSFPGDMVNDGRIRYPAFEYVAACVDTAFTSKQQNDRSAMVVIGIFRAEGRGRIERRGDGTMVRVADDYGFPKALIMYGWAKRLELHGPPEIIPAGITREEWASPGMRARRRETWGLVETVDDTCKRYRVDHLTILTLGQGHGLEQELRRLHSDGAYGVSMEAEVGDKEARAYAVQHLFSARQVYSPMYEDGTVPTWCEPLLDELCIFPRGQHDDFVDATVGCLRHLRQIGLMERREEFDRGEERSMMWETNRRVQLPYDL
jgi:predicted phage terminase large subunit-like protein